MDFALQINENGKKRIADEEEWKQFLEDTMDALSTPEGKAIDEEKDKYLLQVRSKSTTNAKRASRNSDRRNQQKRKLSPTMFPAAEPPKKKKPAPIELPPSTTQEIRTPAPYAAGGYSPPKMSSGSMSNPTGSYRSRDSYSARYTPKTSTYSPPRKATYSPPKHTYDPPATYSPPKGNTYDPPASTYSPPMQSKSHSGYSPPRTGYSPPKDSYSSSRSSSSRHRKSSSSRKKHERYMKEKHRQRRRSRKENEEQSYQDTSDPYANEKYYRRSHDSFQESYEGYDPYARKQELQDGYGDQKYAGSYPQEGGQYSTTNTRRKYGVQNDTWTAGSYAGTWSG